MVDVDVDFVPAIVVAAVGECFLDLCLCFTFFFCFGDVARFVVFFVSARLISVLISGAEVVAVISSVIFLFFFVHGSWVHLADGRRWPRCSISAAGAGGGRLWRSVFTVTGVVFSPAQIGTTRFLVVNSWIALFDEQRCLRPCFIWFVPNRRARTISDLGSGTFNVIDFTYDDNLPSGLFDGMYVLRGTPSRFNAK